MKEESVEPNIIGQDSMEEESVESDITGTGFYRGR